MNYWEQIEIIRTNCENDGLRRWRREESDLLFAVARKGSDFVKLTINNYNEYRIKLPFYRYEEVNNWTTEQDFIIYKIQKSPKGNDERVRIYAYVYRIAVQLFTCSVEEWEQLERWTTFYYLLNKDFSERWDRECVYTHMYIEPEFSCTGCSQRTGQYGSTGWELGNSRELDPGVNCLLGGTTSRHDTTFAII